MLEGPSHPIDIYSQLKAIEAVKKVASQSWPHQVKAVEHVMDRYDMTPNLPSFRWRDLPELCYGFGVVVSMGLRGWLSDRLSHTSASSSAMDRTLSKDK